MSATGLQMHMSVHSPGTIRNSLMFGEHICPVECTAKLLLFIGVSTIIMYIPLGRFMYCDPNCNTNNYKSKFVIWDNNNTSAMCCLCDIYKMVSHMGLAIVNIFDQFISYILKLLYGAKMQFYQMLGTLDNEDLCRSVCCEEADLHNCRCPKHTNCRHRG